MLIQLNDRLVHNLNEIQRQMGSDSRRRKDSHKEKKHPKGASKSKKSRYSSSSSRESSGSSEELGSSRDKYLRRRKYRKDELQGELRKVKPPTFRGDNKKGEDVEAWLLGM